MSPSKNNGDITTMFIQDGLIDKALEAAKIRGIPLSTEEMDTLVKQCILKRRNNSDLKKALVLAKRGVSRGTLDSLVSIYLEKGWMEHALEAAGLGATQETLNHVISVCLKRKRDIRSFREALKLAQQGVSWELIDPLVKKCLEKGWISDALVIAELGASQETINFLVETIFDKIEYLSNVNNLLKAVELRGKDLSPEEKNLLVSNCVQKGWIDLAIQYAELRGTPLSSKEKDYLVKKCVEEGWIEKSFEAAKIRGTFLSDDEIDSLIKARFAKRSVYDQEELQKVFPLLNDKLSQEAVNLLVIKCQEVGWFSQAIRVAGFGASIEIIESLVSTSISTGWIDDALKAAEVRGNPLSKQEKDSLVKACINKGAANDTIRAVKIRGAPLSTKEKRALINVGIEPRSPSCEAENDYLVKYHCARGDFDYAFNAARHASQEGFNFLIKKLEEECR